jgi:hypothetical protein
MPLGLSIALGNLDELIIELGIDLRSELLSFRGRGHDPPQLAACLHFSSFPG